MACITVRNHFSDQLRISTLGSFSRSIDEDLQDFEEVQEQNNKIQYIHAEFSCPF